MNNDDWSICRLTDLKAAGAVSSRRYFDATLSKLRRTFLRDCIGNDGQLYVMARKFITNNM